MASKSELKSSANKDLGEGRASENKCHPTPRQSHRRRAALHPNALQREGQPASAQYE